MDFNGEGKMDCLKKLIGKEVMIYYVASASLVEKQHYSKKVGTLLDCDHSYILLKIGKRTEFFPSHRVIRGETYHGD